MAPKGIPSSKLQNGVTGMKESVKYFSYLSGAQKNSAIARSYGIATKKYRKELVDKTPESDTGKISGIRFMTASGKRKKKLKQSVGVIRSKKYRGTKTLVVPTWVGHVVKRGGRANHLVVRGRSAIKQDGSKLERRKGKRKKYMRFLGADGAITYNKEVAKSKPNPYVQQTYNTYKDSIFKGFQDSFIEAMNRVAKRDFKKYYREV